MEKIIALKEKLKKISLFVESIEGNNISIIEKDILLQKLREFYLEVYNLDATKAATDFMPEPGPKVQVLTKEEPVKVEFSKPETVKPEPVKVVEEIKPQPVIEEPKKVEIIPDPVIEVDEIPVIDDDEIFAEEKIDDDDLFDFAEPEEVVSTPEPVKNFEPTPEPVRPVEQKPEPIIQEPVKKPVVEQASLFGGNGSSGVKTLGEQLGQNKTSLNEVLAQKSAPQDITSRLKPVTDIKAAIGVGDRFLYIRELFGGSTDTFDETINHLNSLHSFADAQSYLSAKFGWDETSGTVGSFLNVVKRRYV
ncbi:MAG: hypothetical protein PHE56_15415 [Bacteroidales bacterium]|nr:hypothetical protein [Bacteroidales bacterium]